MDFSHRNCMYPNSSGLYVSDVLWHFAEALADSATVGAASHYSPDGTRNVGAQPNQVEKGISDIHGNFKGVAPIIAKILR